MPIDFNHTRNCHSLNGPRTVLPALLARTHARSLLDVGCGVGTWASVAIELGIKETLGLDGVRIPPKKLLVPEQCFRQQDLTEDWSLGRRFDLAICLEVAEHLEAKYAQRLIRSLTNHSDTIAFSAACPGQVGQHHVNCRWPAFWQDLFNREGFYCDESIRWALWNEVGAEPWYRQNLFLALRNEEKAGREPRMRPVIHPEFLLGKDYQQATRGRYSSMEFIEGGGMPIRWYLSVPFRGLCSKVTRRLRNS